MNVYQARKVLEAKMNDKWDIYRRVTVINPDGTTSIKLSEEPIYKGIPGRISFIRYKVENPSDINIDENVIKNTPKIFLPVFTDIKAGDTVIKYGQIIGRAKVDIKNGKLYCDGTPIILVNDGI